MGKSNFSNRVVIITGSSSGIGRDTAQLFGQAGASITIHGRSTQGLKETQRLLAKNGVPADRVLCIQGLLENDSVVKQLVADTVKRFGRLDVLVNNAAAAQKPGIDTESVENFDYIFKVNVRAAVQLTQLAIDHLEKTNGCVVNVGSIGSLRGSPNLIFYTMSKAALDHFTRNAAVKYAARGVRVNGVLPGGIHSTNFIRRLGLPLEVIRSVEEIYTHQFIPQRRFGEPREVSSVIKFLASDEASYVNGALWVVDGATAIAAPSLLNRSESLKL